MKFVRSLHSDLKKPISTDLQPFEENVMALAHPVRQTPAVEDHAPGSKGDGDAGPDPLPGPVDAPQQVPNNKIESEAHYRGDQDGRADQGVQEAHHHDAVH